MVPALIAAALFGAATPLNKSLLASLGPFQLSGLLYLGAALGVLPSVWRGGWRSLSQSDIATRRRLAGAIGSGGILGPVLLLFGLRLAAAASVSLWLSMEAVATAVLGGLFFHDRVGRSGWMGVAGILAASAMLSMGEGIAGWKAGALVAMACVCWGLDNHLTALIDGITPAQSTFWKGLVAGTVNLAIGVAMEPWKGSAAMVLGAVLVGTCAYGISIMLYISAAQRLGATRSQLVFSTSPYFGIALAVLLLGERLSMMQLSAAGLAGMSILMLAVERHSHAHQHAPMDHEHFHRHDDEHHDHEHAAEVEAHNHRHAHAPLIHLHRHWPDLHHRHWHR